MTALDTPTLSTRSASATAAQPATPFPSAPRPGRVEVRGPAVPGGERVLTPEALALVAHLHDRFASRRAELLAARAARRTELADGRRLLERSAGTAVRYDPAWRVAGPGPGLADRRVELAGPADAATAQAALTSGASTWVADLEDGTSPTWANVVTGQVVLADVARQWPRVGGPDSPPTVVLRPRGWHLVEKHLCHTDGSGRSTPTSAALVDVALFVAANATALIDRGQGPYLYLPKIENAAEARLWDDVLSEVERVLGLPHKTIRATVLIETVTAALEMEEILHELRHHCAGLNAGRWDYLSSIVRTLHHRGPSWTLPDRAALPLTAPLMQAYTDRLIATCHRRGAHAIGGLSTAVPEGPGTDAVLSEVAADKHREAGQGFDGTWVAHPGLVGTARRAFDDVLAGATDQLHRRRDDVRASDAALLDPRDLAGPVTDAGVRSNVSVAVRYMEAWLRGVGTVVLDGSLEDAATAEVSRAQLWQWTTRGTVTVEGTRVTRALVEQLLAEVLAEQPRTPGDRFADAAALFRSVTLTEPFPTFFTVPGYVDHLVDVPAR